MILMFYNHLDHARAAARRGSRIGDEWNRKTGTIATGRSFATIAIQI
jgi:hypothetical protein